MAGRTPGGVKGGKKRKERLKFSFVAPTWKEEKRERTKGRSQHHPEEEGKNAI